MITANPERNSLVKVLFNKKVELYIFQEHLFHITSKQKKIEYFKDLSIVSFKQKALLDFFKI